MPRRIGTAFGDVVGKLDVLRVECSKCGRFGRYALRRLIAATHGVPICRTCFSQTKVARG
jgi:hypothetical protein